MPVSVVFWVRTRHLGAFSWTLCRQLAALYRKDQRVPHSWKKCVTGAGFEGLRSARSASGTQLKLWALLCFPCETRAVTLQHPAAAATAATRPAACGHTSSPWPTHVQLELQATLAICSVSCLGGCVFLSATTQPCYSVLEICIWIWIRWLMLAENYLWAPGGRDYSNWVNWGGNTYSECGHHNALWTDPGLIYRKEMSWEQAFTPPASSSCQHALPTMMDHVLLKL